MRPVGSPKHALGRGGDQRLEHVLPSRKRHHPPLALEAARGRQGQEQLGERVAIGHASRRFGVVLGDPEPALTAGKKGVEPGQGAGRAGRRPRAKQGLFPGFQPELREQDRVGERGGVRLGERAQERGERVAQRQVLAG